MSAPWRTGAHTVALILTKPAIAVVVTGLAFLLHGVGLGWIASLVLASIIICGGLVIIWTQIAVHRARRGQP